MWKLYKCLWNLAAERCPKDEALNLFMLNPEVDNLEEWINKSWPTSQLFRGL